MTFNRWHLAFLFLGILGGAFGTYYGPLRHADLKAIHSHDSLVAVVKAFEARHDTLVRVDTLRATHIVTLRSKADTIIQQVTLHTRDTLLVRLVDSAATMYRQALDTLGQRVTFWRASFGEAVGQRDAALSQLATALARRDPLLSVSAGPSVSVLYDPFQHRLAAGPGLSLTFHVRLPHIF